MGLFDWFRRKQPAARSDRTADASDTRPAADEDAAAATAAAAADHALDDDDDDDQPFDEGVEPPLTDELDLHTFQPRDCADIVEEYVRAAHEAGFANLRIIHGKGKGTLRRIVHSVLEKHPAVRTFRLADPRSGSWGATLVELHPRPAAP
jgi:DNA-nicking Smr family endonuclease